MPLYMEETQLRITYIEYRSPLKITINFFRNTAKFHWFSLQNSFFHTSPIPVVGGIPFGELEKIIFLIQYKNKLIILGDFFC